MFVKLADRFGLDPSARQELVGLLAAPENGGGELPNGEASDEAEERLIQRLIDRHPEITTATVLKRIRKAAYRGGRSAAYAFVAELRG